MEAARHLKLLERAGVDVERLLGEATVEQIQRVEARFELSKKQMAELNAAQGWMTEESKELKGSCSAKLEKGTLALRMSFELEGCDIVNAFAAWLELDVHCGFDRLMPSAGDAEIVTVLAGAHNPMDAVWSVLSHERNLAAREDNVWQLSAVDALDEPDIGALWVYMCTPDEDSARTGSVRGVTIPETQPSRTRTSRGWGVYMFTPLDKASDGAAQQGFKLTMIMESAPPPAPQHIMSWIPEFMFKPALRRKLTVLPAALRRGTAKCRDLEQRMTVGMRPELYGAIRRHLTEESPTQAPAQAG